MKTYTIWLAGAIALSACARRAPVEINPEASLLPRWNATLQTPAELAGVLQVKGSGWMSANERDTTRTQAHVEISNASPGGRHPWHVHRGSCGNDLGIIGAADAYPPLEVGGDGRASATATLDVPEPKSGDYFINVHASTSNMGTIVACGNLAPPAR